MTCHYCRTTCKRFGKHRNGLQRFRCNQCSKTFTEDHERPLDEMRLPLDKGCEHPEPASRGHEREKH
jgi:transposase-like protein